jgi:hypothetical protein
MSMKNSDTIRNRVRDLPVCSAVPQPLRHRVPPYAFKEKENKLLEVTFLKHTPNFSFPGKKA